MNSIANNTLGEALDTFEAAFSSFFEQNQTENRRKADCRAMRNVVAEVLLVLQGNKPNKAFRSETKNKSIGPEDSECRILSRILVSEYRISGNAALAVIMLAWSKYKLRTELHLLAEWARLVWNVNDTVISPSTAAQEGIARFQDFICQCGLSVTLREYGLRHFDSRRTAKQALEAEWDFRCLSMEDIQAIYELAKG